MESAADIATQRDQMPGRALLQHVLDDRVLLSAFVVCGLLFGYQLSVTLLQPPWIKPVTDWLRTTLAWPQLAVQAWVALRLWRPHRPGASTASSAALGLLSYAVARTLWTIADVIVYPQGVPFPSLPDLFFLLQYPFFFLALVLLPGRGGWLPGLRVMLDGLLWISAITALMWYFVLLPIARQSGEPLLSKHINLFYKVADLVLFYGIIMALARPRRAAGDSPVLFLLCLAFASLFVGDVLAGMQLVHQPYTYRAGSWSDLFRFLGYLLFPLAALVRLRLAPTELPSRPSAPTERLHWREALAGMQFVLPSFAAVAASVVIIVQATAVAQSKGDLVLPEAVSIVLLLLATLRPAAMYLEQEQLRRERDAAREQERALRLANARMETFLSMVAHELRTPLTSLIGNVQLMARRLDTLLRLVRNGEEYNDAASVLRALIAWSDQGLGRMRRLVEDVLDETRVRQGRLVLQLEPCDLASVVGQAVQEQLVLNPERQIRWIAEVSAVPVLADANRIQQVVANLVSNALKFSRADQAVEVRLSTEHGVARVAVHDDGVGIPLADQPHIWEQFYQAAGTGVQSGSQVGIGIGLYVSRAIVEGHQGQVGVESTLGKGTTVWFTLPLAAPLASPQVSASPEVGRGSSASTPPPQPSRREHEREQQND